MSTVDRVQRSVMDRMLRGALAPGTWMRQDELAASMGVSKIPVREALQRLAALGLLRFEPNRGAVIPALTAAEADENFTLRRAVEPELLRRSIPKLTIVDLAEAELALASDRPATSDADPSGLEANWRFHRAIYVASGWERGLAVVEILHASVAPYVRLYTDSLGGGSDSDVEHQALLDACRSGDVDGAVDLLDAHLDHAATALRAFLDDDVVDGPAARGSEVGEDGWS
ncbi:MAG: GntR family transcriptional regulator [Ilumatobacter sp.]|uniref:GntR family transcriptional regulator n=1 Tax=Ilumatobacter sp. TaxID=1967498 RepID=UPI003297B0BF